MIRACFDVWCDLCKNPAQATAGGSETRGEARAVAKKARFSRLRIDDTNGRTVCRPCEDGGARYTIRMRQNTPASLSDRSEPIGPTSSPLNPSDESQRSP